MASNIEIRIDYRFPGLFLNYGSNGRPINILMKKMRYGDPNLLTYLQAHCTPRQCANALMAYLKARNRPLLPNRVQELLISM